MQKSFFIAISLAFLLAVTHTQVWACDSCALSNALNLQDRAAGDLNLLISEQYSDFDRAKDADDDLINEGDEIKGFSNTQFSLNYELTDKLGLSLGIPLITRKFDSVGGLASETDSKIGDVSLTGAWSLLDYEEGESFAALSFNWGVKFPTGDTGVLGEISNSKVQAEEVDRKEEEEHREEEPEHVEKIRDFKNHQVGSGLVGGRAFAFGTGSYDYILGLNLLTRHQRYLLISNVQYTIRTEGDFDYEFADDYLFSFGPAYYLVLKDNFSLAGGVVLSGEFKGKDKLESELVSGSQISNYYLGPQLLCNLSDDLSAEFGFDFRVSGEDLNATVVPGTRLRAGLAYRF